MLKKAGIIVAVVAAGVVGVSSVAFADVSKGNLGNDCTFGNAGGGAASDIAGGDSLLGDVGATLLSSIVTNATSQVNSANCTNVNTSDLFDSDSNNKTESAVETMVKHSYNS